MAKARPIRLQMKQLKELQAAMKRGETAIEPKAVSQLLADALELIRNQALENLRQIPGYKRLTGKLEDSLRTKISRTNLRGVFGAWTKAGSRLAPHAHLFEYGHRIVGHRPARRDTGKKTKERPFYRPAVDAKRKDVRRKIRLGLQEMLGKAFGFGKPGDAKD